MFLLNDIFYVGWKQRSETFLNAGYDINTPNNGRQFYWLNGEWRTVTGTGNCDDQAGYWANVS